MTTHNLTTTIKKVTLVSTISKKVEVKNTFEARQGPPGPPGEQGEVGPAGIQGPVGPSGEGDKTASLDFTNQSIVNFTHNLGKYPSVTVIDSAGDEVEGDIDHISINEVQASFIGGFTGKIICN